MDNIADKDIFRRTVKVTFEDGDHLTTGINGTVEEITNYYVGKTFNLGVVEDRMVKATSVEFLA